MPKSQTVKLLSEEQRERILQTPGVIVHRRDPSDTRARFVPSIRVETPISVRELLGRDDGDEVDPSE